MTEREERRPHDSHEWASYQGTRSLPGKRSERFVGWTCATCGTEADDPDRASAPCPDTDRRSPPREPEREVRAWERAKQDLLLLLRRESLHPELSYDDNVRAILEELRARLRTIPERSPIDVVAAVRRDDQGRVWLARRNADGAHAGLAGMWEYPGGKVEPGEQLMEALRREIMEEFGVEATINRVLDSIDSCYADATGEKVYRVTFFDVTMPDPAWLRNHTATRWMTPADACAVEHLSSGTIFNARHLAERSPEVGERPTIACSATVHSGAPGTHYVWITVTVGDETVRARTLPMQQGGYAEQFARVLKAAVYARRPTEPERPERYTREEVADALYEAEQDYVSGPDTTSSLSDLLIKRLRARPTEEPER